MLRLKDHKSRDQLYYYEASTAGELYEPPHDKINKIACAPSEDSDQPGHPPSLITAQADLSLRWAHMPFCWFCHEAAHIYLFPDIKHYD